MVHQTVNLKEYDEHAPAILLIACCEKSSRCFRGISRSMAIIGLSKHPVAARHTTYPKWCWPRVWIVPGAALLANQSRATTARVPLGAKGCKKSSWGFWRSSAVCHCCLPTIYPLSAKSFFVSLKLPLYWFSGVGFSECSLDALVWL